MGHMRRCLLSSARAHREMPEVTTFSFALTMCAPHYIDAHHIEAASSEAPC